MLMVVIAIFAVDFKFFPQRFMKTETFGTSLMDIGVGCMIFNAGIFAQKSLSKNPPIKMQFKKAFLTSFPLIALGLVRVFSVKSLDYQVPGLIYFRNMLLNMECIGIFFLLWLPCSS